MLPLRRALVAVAVLAPVVTLLGSTPATVVGADRTLTAADGVQLRTASPIVVNAPRTVKAGGTIRVVGDVVVKKRRTVKLAERRGTRWKVLARTVSARNGNFAFRVPAGKAVRTRVFRAQAAASAGLGAVATRAFKVKVTTRSSTTGPVIPGTADYDPAEGLPDGYAAAGAKGDWSYLFEDDQGHELPVRWAPCDVIRWRYNASGEAYDARADVTRAIAKIAGVSGLRFKYLGSTSFSYRGQQDPSFPDNADLFVSWANEASYPSLGGSTVGVGGGYGTSAGAAQLGVDFRMTDGYLTLDKGASQIARGFDGSGWGQIMMHETLHAMGLGHAASNPQSRQVMAPTATDLNYRFGAGDITGMHDVGVRPTDDCE